MCRGLSKKKAKIEDELDMLDLSDSSDSDNSDDSNTESTLDNVYSPAIRILLKINETNNLE